MAIAALRRAKRIEVNAKATSDKPRLLPVLALTLFSVVPPSGASATCQLESVALPVMMSGLQPLVRAGINGTEVSFVVDSGAVYSMIAPAAAQRLQLPYRRAPDQLRVYGVGGRADVHVTRVERFTLRNTTFNNVEFI